jgi:hypothetical protein
LLDEFLREEYEESPVNASDLGRIEYDDSGSRQPA